MEIHDYHHERDVTHNGVRYKRRELGRALADERAAVSWFIYNLKGIAFTTVHDVNLANELEETYQALLFAQVETQFHSAFPELAWSETTTSNT